MDRRRSNKVLKESSRAERQTFKVSRRWAHGNLISGSFSTPKMRRFLVAGTVHDVLPLSIHVIIKRDSARQETARGCRRPPTPSIRGHFVIRRLANTLSGSQHWTHQPRFGAYERVVIITAALDVDSLLRARSSSDFWLGTGKRCGACGSIWTHRVYKKKF